MWASVQGWHLLNFGTLRAGGCLIELGAYLKKYCTVIAVVIKLKYDCGFQLLWVWEH